MGDRPTIPHVRIASDLIRCKVWASLSGPAKGVLLPLLDHAGSDGRCWPSKTTLAKLSGLGRTATYDAVRELEQKGLVKTERTGGGRSDGGSYRRTVYRLTVRDGVLIDPSTVREGEHQPSAKANATVREGERNRPPSRTRNHHHEPTPVTNPIEPPKHGASRPCGRDGLGHVEEADLAKPEGWLKLYCRWRGCPTPTAIDDDLLQFAAAAVHALTATPKNGKAIKSRASLFASMIRKGDYSMVSNADEDEARRRLNEHLHGTPAKREKPYDPTA